jgi:hypothetical protein
MATLEPKDGEINGGEYHSVKLELDEEGFLQLQVEGMCYGTHGFSFNMLLSSIEPDEVEKFGLDLTKLADEMRKKDAENH